jgi:hypothetical protein
VFCENETNAKRIFGIDGPPHPKDAIGEYVVSGNAQAPNPERRGTKCAARYRFTIPAGGRSRCAAARPDTDDGVASGRRTASSTCAGARRTNSTPSCRRAPSADARLVQRQALAGMIWSKQFYNYDVGAGCCGDDAQPPPPEARLTRAMPTGITS